MIRCGGEKTSSLFLVLGSWFLVPGSWFLVLGSWSEVGARRLERGGWSEEVGGWSEEIGGRWENAGDFVSMLDAGLAVGLYRGASEDHPMERENPSSLEGWISTRSASPRRRRISGQVRKRIDSSAALRTFPKRTQITLGGEP